ncbi:MAG: C4-type zinc ribbon domain-containing protein [Planctomycetota bacterium]
MDERLERLLALQSADVELQELRGRLGEIPRSIRRVEERLRALERKFTTSRERLKKRKEEGRLKELELASSEDKAHRLKLQLLQVRENREYQTLQREIEHELAEASQYESEAIAVLEEVDGLSAECKELAAEIESKRKELDGEKLRLAGELAALEGQLERQSKVRAELAAAVDSEFLSAYSRLVKRYAGQSVVPVMGQTCTGCRLRLTAQVMSVLLVGRELVFCPDCARILYIGDAITAEEV